MNARYPQDDDRLREVVALSDLYATDPRDPGATAFYCGPPLPDRERFERAIDEAARFMQRAARKRPSDD